jgi:hypothetical protein
MRELAWGWGLQLEKKRLRRVGSPAPWPKMCIFMGCYFLCVKGSNFTKISFFSTLSKRPSPHPFARPAPYMNLTTPIYLLIPPPTKKITSFYMAILDITLHGFRFWLIAVFIAITELG